MPTKYSDYPTADGYCYSVSSSNWTTARDATSANSVSSGSSASSSTVSSAQNPTRGGGSSWRIRRSFFKFDTSEISVAPSAATLKVYGSGQTSGDIMAVKSTHSDTLALADVDAITGWIAGADNEGNVTKYSAEITTWSSSAYNDIALTSAALSDMASLNLFKVCLIEYDYDLTNNEPPRAGGGGAAVGMYFTDNTGTSKAPYLDYTAGVAVTDNAIFFGHNF